MSRPEQNGGHFADIFNCIFLYENCFILDPNVTEVHSCGPSCQLANISLGNALVLSRQAIAPTKSDPYSN